MDGKKLLSQFQITSTAAVAIAFIPAYKVKVIFNVSQIKFYFVNLMMKSNGLIIVDFIWVCFCFCRFFN